MTDTSVDEENPLHSTPFEAVRLLGSGATGDVLLARDKRTNEFVAVKVLIERPNAQEARIRFLNEQHMRFSHPNVVGNLDWLQDRTRSILAMEYANAGDLQTWLDRRNDVSAVTAVDISRQLLAGIAYLHDHGIVHRDMKPSNVLLHVTDQPVRPLVRISDFGLAIAIGAPRVTMMPSAVGTAGFIAPEVAEGFDADERSDLFALGIVLRMVLDRCGQPAPALDRLIGRLCSPDRADRPSSAREAMRALGEVPDEVQWPEADRPIAAELPKLRNPAAVLQAPVRMPRPVRAGLLWLRGKLPAIAALCAVMPIAGYGFPWAIPPAANERPIAAGTVEIGGRDASQDEPIGLDLSRAIEVRMPSAPPDARRAQLEFSAGRLPMPASNVSDLGFDGGSATATLLARTGRFITSGEVSAWVVLQSENASEIERYGPISVRPEQPFWATGALWAAALLTAFVAAYLSALVRPLRRGRRQVANGIGVILLAAVGGFIVAVWNWALGGAAPFTGDRLSQPVLVGAVIGACVALAAVTWNRFPSRPKA